MRKILILAVLSALAFISCGRTVPDVTPEEQKAKIISESEMQVLPLFGEASYKKNEFSSLAWCGDYLVMLPQYPYNYEHNGVGTIFRIKKSIIENYLNGKNTSAITPEKIDFDASGLEKFNVRGGGYESILFVGDRVFVTLESGSVATEAYIASGKIDTLKWSIKLDAASLTQIKIPNDIPNLGDEAVTVFNDTLYTFYEANGKNVNPRPYAGMFTTDLKFIGTKSFPNLEYRITDATRADRDGKFWVMNYFYPGDASDLDPAVDSMVIKFGAGKSQLESPAVERIVEYAIDKTGIAQTGKPPVLIKLAKNKDGRNWEGIVRFGDKGFIVVTDTFPQTILAFVPFVPESISQ